MSNPSIESQIQKLTADLATLGKSLAAIGRQQAGAYQEEANRYVNRFANQAYDRSRDAFGDFQSEFKTIEDALIERVRANPLKTIGIAGGIILLLTLAAGSKAR